MLKCAPAYAEFKQEKFDVKLKVKQDIKYEWPDVQHHEPARDRGVEREPLVDNKLKKEEIKVKREHTLADAVADLAALLGQPSPVRGAPPGLDAAACQDPEVVLVPDSDVAVVDRVQEDVKPKVEAVEVMSESTPAPAQGREGAKRARLLQKLQKRKFLKQEAAK